MIPSGTMPNRVLTEEERAEAGKILKFIERRLQVFAAGDPKLLFAYRRKIAKELTYLERSGPMARRALKRKKRREQGGICAICGEALPQRYTVLDRLRAADGYTSENTRLICEPCDRRVQAERGYA